MTLCSGESPRDLGDYENGQGSEDECRSQHQRSHGSLPLEHSVAQRPRGPANEQVSYEPGHLQKHAQHE
jgi:hypothetical protein